jgi:hypothetical protein
MNFDLNHLFHWLTPVTFVSPLKIGNFSGSIPLISLFFLLFITAVVVVVELVVKFIMA